MLYKNKDLLIFNHYKYIIENRLFDEYDILGFLIFIREKADTNKLIYIADFCDLVAHRTRDRGRVYEALKELYAKSELIKNSVVKYNPITKEKRKPKKVKFNNKGIKEINWEDEWRKFSEIFEIEIDEQIVKELMLCIFSLTQFTTYNKGGIKGEVNLFQDRENGTIHMIVQRTITPTFAMCYSICGPFEFIKEIDTYFFEQPVETKRENGKLRLVMNDEYII